MATNIDFQAKSGAHASGAFALPAGEDKAPGLVLVQEWWGVDDHIRSLVDRFAAAGFVVLAPDLYEGVIAERGDSAKASKLMTELDGAKAMDKIAGAVAWLKGHARGNGKVGITGFCMGGAYSFAATSAVPDIGAAVPFYGIPPAERLDFTKMKAPILAHFASRDGWAKPESAREIVEHVNRHGGNAHLEVYDADHAFVNDKRPEVYAEQAAKLAVERTVKFLHQHLG